MPLDIVSMAIYVTLEGKIPRTPIGFGIVLFTLIVQATTNPMLVRKLKIEWESFNP